MSSSRTWLSFVLVSMVPLFGCGEPQLEDEVTEPAGAAEPDDPAELDDPADETIRSKTSNFCVDDVEGVVGLRCFATDREAALVAGDPDHLYESQGLSAPALSDDMNDIVSPGLRASNVYTIATLYSKVRGLGDKIYITTTNKSFCSRDQKNKNNAIYRPDFRKFKFDNKLSSIKTHLINKKDGPGGCLAFLFKDVNYRGAAWWANGPNKLYDLDQVRDSKGSTFDNAVSSACFGGGCFRLVGY